VRCAVHGRQLEGHTMPFMASMMQLHCCSNACQSPHVATRCHLSAAGCSKVAMSTRPLASLGLLMLVFVMVTEMPHMSAATRMRVLMQQPPVDATCTSTCAELCANCQAASGSDGEGPAPPPSAYACIPPYCQQGQRLGDSTGSATSKCTSLVDPATSHTCPCTLCQQLSG
jgi:hypothetical protein